MNQWKQGTDRQGKCGDGFGTPRHRSAPFSFDHTQNRRDQRAGLADTDPEHEVRFMKAPEYRPIVAGNGEAVVHLIRPGGQTGDHEAAKEGDAGIELPRRPQQRTQQVIRDLLSFYGLMAHSKFLVEDR